MKSYIFSCNSCGCFLFKTHNTFVQESGHVILKVMDIRLSRQPEHERKTSSNKDPEQIKCFQCSLVLGTASKHRLSYNRKLLSLQTIEYRSQETHKLSTAEKAEKTYVDGVLAKLECQYLESFRLISKHVSDQNRALDEMESKMYQLEAFFKNKIQTKLAKLTTQIEGKK